MLSARDLQDNTWSSEEILGTVRHRGPEKIRICLGGPQRDMEGPQEAVMPLPHGRGCKQEASIHA